MMNEKEEGAFGVINASFGFFLMVASLLVPVLKMKTLCNAIASRASLALELGMDAWYYENYKRNTARKGD